MQLVCCKEQHQGGADHYHIALKFLNPKKWKPTRETMLKEQNIVFHFQMYTHYSITLLIYYSITLLVCLQVYHREQDTPISLFGAT